PWRSLRVPLFASLTTGHSAEGVARGAFAGMRPRRPGGLAPLLLADLRGGGRRRRPHGIEALAPQADARFAPPRPPRGGRDGNRSHPQRLGRQRLEEGRLGRQSSEKRRKEEGGRRNQDRRPGRVLSSLLLSFLLFEADAVGLLAGQGGDVGAVEQLGQ